MTRWWTGPRLLLALVVATGCLVALFSFRWFIYPAEDTPERADAVVMLAGGRGERLEVARVLIDDELAPVLVVMNGLNWSKGFDLCMSDAEPFEVICPSGPGDTRGEAREIRSLAEERGWDSIILVTSDFHLHRASTNVGRCFDGTLQRVAAQNTFGLGREVQAVVVEWAGTFRNLVRRGC